jgi:hypothetical protein
MASKDLFIHTIQQIEVDGDKNIPTALYYTGTEEYVVGYEAFGAAPDITRVNQDFKVDPGRHDSRGNKTPQRFPTASGDDVSFPFTSITTG